MATRIRCLKCFQIIECAPYDRSILLEHIKTNHPEIMLPDNITNENSSARKPRTSMNSDTAPDSNRVSRQSNRDQTSGQQGRPRSGGFQPPEAGPRMEEVKIRQPGQRPMYTRKYNIHSPKVPHSPQKRRMYRTSVEKWRPAKGTIYCPKCGANRRPIIRTRTEKMSYSTLGAACILTCWPLCFLPCIFPAPAQNYLHCAECNNFLGMYDKENNCVRPNREFVDGSTNKLPDDTDQGDNMQQKEIDVPYNKGVADNGRNEPRNNTGDVSGTSSDRKTV